MSISVGLHELRDKIDEFHTDPYLLTVSDDGRAHTVAVAVALRRVVPPDEITSSSPSHWTPTATLCARPSSLTVSR